MAETGYQYLSHVFNASQYIIVPTYKLVQVLSLSGQLKQYLNSFLHYSSKIAGTFVPFRAIETIFLISLALSLFYKFTAHQRCIKK